MTYSIQDTAAPQFLLLVWHGKGFKGVIHCFCRDRRWCLNRWYGLEALNDAGISKTNLHNPQRQWHVNCPQCGRTVQISEQIGFVPYYKTRESVQEF